MGVNRMGRLAEGDVEHDIGGLAPDAWQRLQTPPDLPAPSPPCSATSLSQSAMTFFALVRNRPMVLMCSRTLSSPSASIFFRRVRDGEQGARRLVDAGIRRLRREHHGDQQREDIHMLKLALRLRIGGLKPGENCLDLGGRPRLDARPVGRFAPALPCGNVVRADFLCVAIFSVAIWRADGRPWLGYSLQKSGARVRCAPSRLFLS